MAKLETYVCDVCGAHKGAEGGWWQLDTTGAVLMLGPFGKVPTTSLLDFCGPPCVLRKVEEFMGGAQR